MKSLQQISLGAVAIILALLVLPANVLAATTVTVNVTPGSVSDSQSYTVSGTVSPPPSGVSATIQVFNPSNTLVDQYSATVDPTTGAYSHTFVAGGTANWVSGTYTVKVTVPGATGTGTFQYTAVTPAPTVSGQPFQIRVIAPDQAYPGETVNIFIETTFNGTLVGNSSTVSFHAHVWWVSSPNATAGTFQLLPTPSNFAVGHFITSWKVPSNAALGSVAWVHVPGSYNGYKATGVAGVTIVANPATIQTDLMGNFSSLSKAVSSLQTSLSTLASSVSTIQTDLMGNFSSLSKAVSSLQTSLSTLASSVSTIQSALNGLSSTASSLSSTLTSIQNSLTTLGNTASSLSSQLGTISSKVDNAATQASNAASAVGTTQLYVLIVAVIAAITLVLELAILVRKLS